jgi:Cu+-exporting ATPase
MPFDLKAMLGRLGARLGAASSLGAAVSDSELDPVCGMSVRPDSPHRHLHASHSYLFCSAHCRERFSADPLAYLHETAAMHQVEAQGEYSCPMHPEIRQPGRGICPKCGMALEPVLPLDGEAANPELLAFRRRFWWSLPMTMGVVALAMSFSSVSVVSNALRLRSVRL